MTRRLTGFTLLELLVALAILTLATAFVVPMMFGGTSASELQASARTVAAALRSARSRAIARNEPTVVDFDVAAHALRIPGATRDRPLPARIALELFTASEERRTADRAGIRFFPDGSSTGGRLTLRAGERVLAVDVDWLTGRVRLLDADDRAS